MTSFRIETQAMNLMADRGGRKPWHRSVSLGSRDGMTMGWLGGQWVSLVGSGFWLVGQRCGGHCETEKRK